MRKNDFFHISCTAGFHIVLTNSAKLKGELRAMGIVKKFISAALAITVAASQSVVSATAANKKGTKLPASYHNIFLPESKVVSDEKPFQVFDIYNAYYGITTTKPPVTTTKPTTTTTTTTTTVTTTTTSTTTTVTTTTTTTTTTVTTTAIPTTTTVTTTTAPTTTTVTTTKKPETTAVKTSVGTSTAAIVSTNAPVSSAVSDVTGAVTAAAVVTTKPFAFPDGTYLKGIDVSQFQSDIDWYKVKNSGDVDFAIIRAGYGQEYDQKDKKFDQNARNAQAAGMDFGIYWYSYALDVDSVRKEAEVCMSMLDGYSFTYPVFFDIEEISQRDQLSPAQFSAIVDTFCSTLEENGYTAGVYSFGSMLETKLYDKIIEKYSVWVAEYNTAVSVYKGDYDIWQYSSTGKVDGIDTAVDLDYCYVDLAKKIGVNPSHGSLPAVTSTTVVPGAEPSSTTTAAVSSPNVIAGTAGVKLSAENGSIDWVKLKKSGIKFAMIKAAESGTDPEAPELDSAFIENLEAAQKNELGVGLYWHSKAMTADDMEKEAETFIGLISEIKPNYPVYLDMTDAVYQSSTVTSEEMTLLAEAFCTKLEEENFYVGIYGTDKALNKLDSKLFAKFDVWLSVGIATAPEFSRSTGITGISGINVPGIKGGVEFLSTGKNYPSVMEKFHLNGF